MPIKNNNINSFLYDTSSRRLHRKGFWERISPYSTKTTKKFGVVEQDCHTRYRVAEAGDSLWVQGHPGLHIEVKTSLSYIERTPLKIVSWLWTDSKIMYTMIVFSPITINFNFVVLNSSKNLYFLELNFPVVHICMVNNIITIRAVWINVCFWHLVWSLCMYRLEIIMY